MPSVKCFQVIAISTLITLNACGGGGDGGDEHDSTPPIITLLGANPLNVFVGSSYVDPGATASDDVDGDITTDIVIAGDVVNRNLVGTYFITYDVNDTSGNPAQRLTRNVSVVNEGVDINPDVIAPVITLLGANPLSLLVGEPYIDPGATASDVVDGDISPKIIVAGDFVDSNLIGTYIVTYDVSDTAGNPAQQLTRSVIVTNGSLIIDQFTAQPNPSYSTVATTFYWQVSDPEGSTLTCSLDVNNDGSEEYIINNCANIASQQHTYTTSGEYTARLTVTDGKNNTASILPLTVNLFLSLDVSVDGPVRASPSREFSSGRGNRAQYNITVSNVSVQSVDGVTVALTVPPELQFDAIKDAEPNAINCVTCTGGMEASWLLGTLTPGESRTITIYARVVPFVQTDAVIIVPIKVASTSFSQVVNLNKSVTVDNFPKSRLAINLSKDTLLPGDKLIMTIKVGNIDGLSLNNLKLSAILSAGFNVDVISDNGGVDSTNGNVSWDIPRLAVTKTLTRSIQLNVNPAVIPSQILRARVELSHDGGVALDAFTEQAITVDESEFPLTFSFSAAPDPITPNGILSYILTINNPSSQSVSETQVLLRVPKEIRFDAAIDAVPAALGCETDCADFQEASWVLDPLAGGQSHTINIAALVTAAGGNLISTSVRIAASNIRDSIIRLDTVAIESTVIGDIKLAKKSGCMACHSIDSEIVGPSWTDVAKRYRADPNAQAQLTEKVKSGGGGNWGDVAMPPYWPRIQESNIEALVAYILGL